MKIKKAEESPVVIRKRKETSNALPEYNNGGAFFYGDYKPGPRNI